MNSLIDFLNEPAFQIWGQALSRAEVFGFVTGIACVWMTVRKNIWNFPLGIINSALLAILFFHARLFADFGLQIMFIVLSLMGWYQWGFARHVDDNANNSILIKRLSTKQNIACVLVTVVIVATLYYLLTILKGSIPIFDALITALSIVAQILLNKRFLENWWLWIITDIISIPVYAYKDLWLIAALYVIFLILALTGLFSWKKNYNAQKAIHHAEYL